MYIGKSPIRISMSNRRYRVVTIVTVAMGSEKVFAILQVWQMAENIYNDEEPETPASELESAAS